jgi:hypothetical protein
MAGFVHGKSGSFKIDDSGGTLRDVSPYVSHVDINLDVDIPPTTTLGATAIRRQVVGLKDSAITVTGFHDQVATVGSWTVFTGIYGLAATSTFNWGPEGTATGKPRITGECRLKSFKSGSPVDGVVPFTAELVGDDTVTIDTYP